MWLLFVMLSFLHPESCVFGGDTLFVSDIGEYNNRTDGVIYSIVNGKTTAYAQRLGDPKGLGYWRGDLYAADIDRIWRVSNGKAEIFVGPTDFPEEPNFLNDIAIDSSGNIYVSDTFKGIIFKITQDGKVSVFMRVESPNGLFFDNKGRLYIATFTKPGRVLVLTGKKIDTLFVSPDITMADGVTIDTIRGLLYVSGYKSGEIVRVDLKTRMPKVVARGLKTPADINLNPGGDFLWIPQLEIGKVSPIKVIKEE